MALVLALWSLMAMVWLMWLAQYLRNTFADYQQAGYRLCRLCKGQPNHPHNKVGQCSPDLERMGSSYPTQSKMSSARQ
jgi:hypothetical protein